MKKIITGDESWVYEYDLETKNQSSTWKHLDSPRAKKAQQSRSNVKAMLTVFFDCEGVVHQEYAPQRRTVNKKYYLGILKRLRDAVKRKKTKFLEEWRLAASPR
ncbi:hypothetical protein PGB90_003603 [Kerria lacca]